MTASAPSDESTTSCGVVPVGSVARARPDATSTLVAVDGFLLVTTSVPLSPATCAPTSGTTVSASVRVRTARCLANRNDGTGMDISMASPGGVHAARAQYRTPSAQVLLRRRTG